MIIRTTFLLGLPSFIFLLILPLNIRAQAPTKDMKEKILGGSVQVYPAGLILNLVGQKNLSDRQAILLRLGMNLADRKDFSEYNDMETGGGFGASIGYRYYFPIKTGKFFTGLNADIWNMWINWENEFIPPIETNGQTYTLVIQPWLEAGYEYQFKKSNFSIGLSTGFGREINVITKGKAVGQGWMNSILFNFGWKI